MKPIEIQFILCNLISFLNSQIISQFTGTTTTISFNDNFQQISIISDNSDCNFLISWQPDILNQKNCCIIKDLECNEVTGKVTKLDLSFRDLQGEVPLELGSLTSLLWLSLSANKFVGDVLDVVQYLKEIEVVELFDNQFNGSFHPNIIGLQKLKKFDISGNFFVGSLPSNIGDLNNLEILKLDKNQFSGKIPDSIGKLTLLKTLNVSKNTFSGQLPNSNSFINIESCSFEENSIVHPLCTNPQWKQNEKCAIDSSIKSCSVSPITSTITMVSSATVDPAVIIDGLGNNSGRLYSDDDILYIVKIAGMVCGGAVVVALMVYLIFGVVRFSRLKI